MSDADFDVLRAAYEAFNRRDREGMVAFFDPDAVWIPISSAWGAGAAYRGAEGVGELLDDMARDWQEFEAEPQQFRQVGDLILVLGVVHAVPKQGGEEIRSETAWIWEMRDGRGLRLQAYPEPARALEALGLAE
jgi:ketosteroid isomerase-like protein